MKTTLMSSILVKNLMKSQDLQLGKFYKFPYSQIRWQYIGGSQFYSPEWDLYKEQTLTHFQATPC